MDIVQPLHKDGEVCGVCGSDGGMHFGDCPKHPTKLAMLNKPEPGTVVADARNVVVAPDSFTFLRGCHMNVTEDFLKEAVHKMTGIKVISVKYKTKGSQFIVVFE